MRVLGTPTHHDTTDISVPEHTRRNTSPHLSAQVSGLIARESDRLSLQRVVLTADESVTYARNARNAVVGRFLTVMESRDGTRWAQDGQYWVILSPDGLEHTVVDLGEGAEPGLFWEGMAPFTREGKIGFVTTSGEVIADAQFDDVRAFDGAYARVKLGGRWGAIDRLGRLIVPFVYLEEDVVSPVIDRHVRRAA